MKITSRIFLLFSLFYFFPGTHFPNPSTPGFVFAAGGLSEMMPAAIQRSRGIPAAAAESGSAMVTVAGADNVVDVFLRGGQVTFKTVNGQKPQRVTADFSSSIPAVPNLILSVTKINGRGSVGLSGRPNNGNNYTVTMRVMDSARGRGDYKFRLNWRLPGTPAQVSSSRAPVTRTPVTRNPRAPVKQGPKISKGKVFTRTTSSRIVDKGYVELKINGVDDVVDVVISGNNVSYKIVKGRNPGQVSAEFSNPVPRDAAISLNISKSYGRGNIKLAGMPSAANNYTTTVRLMDTRGGSDNYKFRLNWEKNGSVRGRIPSGSGGYPNSVPAKPGFVEVTVERADDILDIRVRGDKVEYSAVKGGTPSQVSSEFSTPFPRQSLSELVLKKIYGRGNVVLVEGPDQANDFTATVRIMDSERAQDDYRFRLTWDVTEAANSGYTSYDSAFDNTVGQGNYQGIPVYTGSNFQYTKEGSFSFRAIVDETALIKIEQGQLLGMILSGQSMKVLDARFSEGFPQGDMERLDLARTRGRGDVEILEKPWSGNNYAIVIRIHDSRGGDDEYGLELRWKQK
jgi:hypothetical protein